MKKLAENRYCKDCRYYLARYVIVNNKFCDIGGECGNNGPPYQPILIPRELDGKCKHYEYNDGTNGMPF